MKLSTILIIILSLLLIFSSAALKAHKEKMSSSNALTASEELALRLEALSLINGDPQEIEEEAYFNKLHRKEYEENKSQNNRSRNANWTKIKDETYHPRNISI